jgi:hypothetical protein
MAEEVYRDKVRRGLELSEPTPTLRRRLWLFLNSSVALWFLSSIVLTGLTTVFTIQQNRHKEELKNTEALRRLDIEISNRIFQARARLRIDDDAVRNRGCLYAPASIYSNVVKTLNNSHLDEGADFSVYPDYQKRTFRSLVVELNSVVDLSAQSELNETLLAFEDLVDWGSSINCPPEGQKLKTEIYTQQGSLEAIAKADEVLQRRLLKQRWRSTVFSNPPKN